MDTKLRAELIGNFITVEDTLKIMHKNKTDKEALYKC